MAVLYDWLLPALLGRALDPECAAAAAAGDGDDWHNAPQLNADTWSVLHACRYVCRRKGLGVPASEALMLAVKAQMLALAEHDVAFLDKMGRVRSQPLPPPSPSIHTAAMFTPTKHKVHPTRPLLTVPTLPPFADGP